MGEERAMLPVHMHLKEQLFSSITQPHQMMSVQILWSKHVLYIGVVAVSPFTSYI